MNSMLGKQLSSSSSSTPLVSARAGNIKTSGSWLVIILLLLGTSNTVVSSVTKISDLKEKHSCYASGTCEGEGPNGTSVESCAGDAERGLCISNPELMFQRCSPEEYCLDSKDFGAYADVDSADFLIDGYENGESCRDNDTDCQDLAENEHACLLNPAFMRDTCPLSCFLCTDSVDDDDDDHSFVRIFIGEKQTMPPGATRDQKSRFFEVIAETTSYMTNKVFALEEFQDVRRECRNFEENCAWQVASTDGEFCEENQHLCGPACQACADFIFTEDELETLDDCVRDVDQNIFDNGIPEKGMKKKNSGDDEYYDEYELDDFDDSKTLDVMFRRIIGERPYPSYKGESYPIVPGVNFTAKILSRPSLNPDVHHDIPRSDIDFHIGGPWVVVLDDFLTQEECDRLIELGDTLGREASGVEDDDEDDEDEEDEVEWRTSTTAWCTNKVCNKDPIARRVQERIGFTTGVMDNNYYEHLQLLKYRPGQYYHAHHDESGDVHDLKYSPDGPRILTFFLYLNDVEEGGHTRFTDIMGDDTNLHIDVAPKRGRALLWPSMLNHDLLAYDVRTFHAALEVKKGVKFGANAWMHLREFKTTDCDDEAVTEMQDKWYPYI